MISVKPNCQLPFQVQLYPLVSSTYCICVYVSRKMFMIGGLSKLIVHIQVTDTEQIYMRTQLVSALEKVFWPLITIDFDFGI